jgi:hypothetical protein
VLRYGHGPTALHTAPALYLSTLTVWHVVAITKESSKAADKALSTSFTALASLLLLLGTFPALTLPIFAVLNELAVTHKSD